VDLVGGVVAHLQGWLGELRQGLVFGERDVPDREDPVVANDSKVGAGADAAAVGLWQAPAADRRWRATPVAQIVMSLGRAVPSASRTRRGVISAMAVPSRTSTPRLASWRWVYSRKAGWKGASSAGARSMSEMCTRVRSISG
jgi:hypothetical protein